MHNTAFQVLKMDYVYLAFDVQPQSLEQALEGLLALGIVGVNVTAPHKESILPLLDTLSSEARAIGAVNTIVNDGARLSGHNTDFYGFVEMLKPLKEGVDGEEVAVIGAGGAARAVVYGLITNFRPAFIHLLNRSVERATNLKDYFTDSFGFQQIDVVDLYMPAAQEVLARSNVIVNATSLGMSPRSDDSPIRDENWFSKGQVLVDLVYNPLETKLIRTAKKHGAKTISGIEMFLYQGARSFELWTNQKMPLEHIRRKLHTALSET
jgi:shikimate dehydrogenase